MFECLILGDSIAVGVSWQKPQCHVEAKVGINSKHWLASYHVLDAKTTVISLGSNDSDGMNTYAELLKLRTEVHSERVIWIIPGIKPKKRSDVMQVASHFGDITVDIRNGPTTKDHIHPTPAGYKKLAKSI